MKILNFGILGLLLFAQSSSANSLPRRFPEQFHLTSGPQGTDIVAAGDVNGDGKLDLLTGMKTAAAYSLYLGQGDGTFAPPIPVTLEANVFAFVLADIDGDGRADAVVTNYSQNTVRAYPGLAGGGLGPARLLVALSRPAGLAVGDLNHDGREDLLVATYTDQKLRTLLQDSNGDFQAGPVTSNVGSGVAIVLGNLDGDSQPDAVIETGPINQGNTVVFHGTPDGGFAVVQSFVDNESQLALGDFNGDGIEDLADWGYYFNPLTVRLGTGDGTFGPDTHYLSPVGGFGAAVGDWTGDGVDDLALSTAPGAGGSGAKNAVVHLFAGSAFGLVETDQVVPLPLGSQALVAADFDQDGKTDLATAWTGGVAMTPARPQSGFGHVYQVGLSGHAIDVATGDVNGDGRDDLALAIGPAPGTFFRVYTSSPDQTLQQSAAQWRSEVASSIQLDDMNGDGRADLVALVQSPGKLATYFGLPDGSLTGPDDLPLSGPSPVSLAIGSLDNSPIPDVVYVEPVYNGNPGFLGGLLGEGNGSFSGDITFAPSDPRAMALGHVDADDYPDALVIDASGSLELYRGTGGARFAPITPIGYPGNRVGVVLGDLDGDGHLDAVTWPLSGTSLSIFHGVGDGTFSAPLDLPTSGGIGGATLGDVDGNGALDLVVTHAYSVSILYGHGDGTFSSEDEYFVDWNPGLPRVADLDGDGRADIVLNTSLPVLDVLYQRASAVAVSPGRAPPALGLSLASANPARGSMSFRVTEPSEGARLTIFDLHGRAIRTYGPLASSSQGATSVTWDGRTSQGDVAPAGVYFAQLVDAVRRVSARFVMLR